MTIQSTTRKTALSTGNDATTSFSFSFKVQDSDDIVVYRLEDGVESVVDSSEYTVSLNANQNTNPGGTVDFLVAPTSSPQQYIRITTDADATQETNLQNQGGFNPVVLTEQFDKLTILVQQLVEKIGRSLKLRITDTSTNDDLVPETGKALGWGGSGWTWLSNLATATVSSFMEIPLVADSAHAFAKAVGLPLVLGSYTAARALTGVATNVSYRLVGADIAGSFYYDSASVAADDGGLTTLVCADSRRLIRETPGYVNLANHESYTGDGSADDSASFAAAIASGLSIFIPPSKHTKIGTGTALPTLTHGQKIFTTPDAGARTSVTQLATITVGAVGTSCFEAGIGPGFSWACPADREAFELVQGRRFTWHKGSAFSGAYQFAKIGRPQVVLTVAAGAGSYTVGETVTGGTSGATGVVTAWSSPTLTVTWNSVDSFEAAETVTGGTSGTARTVSSLVEGTGWYITENYADINQAGAYIVLSSSTGTFTAGEEITGGSSGATALVTAWDSGTKTLTLYRTSATSFSAAETVTGGSSGATGTVSTVYRPTHLFQALYALGDFMNWGTVEGAYDGSADGFNLDSNKNGARLDEVRIEKYFGRFRRGFSADNARGVNAHFYADMEGCQEATLYFNVTTTAAKGDGYKGWEDIRFDIHSNLTGKNNLAIADVYFRTEDSGVEAKNIHGIVTCKGGEGHGALIHAEAGVISLCDITVVGRKAPTTTGKYGVYVIDVAGSITGLKASVTLTGVGSSPLAAGVGVSGAPVGVIMPISLTGSYTEKLDYTGTPPVGLRFADTENGMPAMGMFHSPDFSAIDMATGAGTISLTRPGGLTRYYPPCACYIAASTAQLSAAPTTGTTDFSVYVDGVLAKGHTNLAVTRQHNRYWPDSTPVYVALGSYIELNYESGAGQAVANIDVVANLTLIPAADD